MILPSTPSQGVVWPFGHTYVRRVDLKIPEKITFRLGPLAESVSRQLKKTGESPSSYLRRLVADDLGEAAPEMLSGNPDFRGAAKSASKAG